MLLTLESAKTFKPTVEQVELDGLEAAIRGITNNRFQNIHIRYFGFEVQNKKELVFQSEPAFLRVGDTIEMSETEVNDGLFVIEALSDKTVTLKGDVALFDGSFKEGFVTKIEYPSDLIAGVQKLLSYSSKMDSKVGVKSESISRMSIQYYDVNASDNVEGYPAALFSFLNKYKKMNWGTGRALPIPPNPFSHHIYEDERRFGDGAY